MAKRTNKDLHVLTDALRVIIERRLSNLFPSDDLRSIRPRSPSVTQNRSRSPTRGRSRSTTPRRSHSPQPDNQSRSPAHSFHDPIDELYGRVEELEDVGRASREDLTARIAALEEGNSEGSSAISVKELSVAAARRFTEITSDRNILDSAIKLQAGRLQTITGSFTAQLTRLELNTPAPLRSSSHSSHSKAPDLPSVRTRHSFPVLRSRSPTLDPPSKRRKFHEGGGFLTVGPFPASQLSPTDLFVSLIDRALPTFHFTDSYSVTLDPVFPYHLRVTLKSAVDVQSLLKAWGTGARTVGMEEMNSDGSNEPKPPTKRDSQPPASTSQHSQETTDRLTESLAAENAEDDGQPLAPRMSHARATGTIHTKTKFIPESVSEEEDEDFDDLPDLEEVSHSSDEGSDSESDFEMIDNEELADLLSSKTVPARGGAVSSKPQTRRKSSGTKRKADESPSVPPHKSSRCATVEEVEDEDAPKIRHPKPNGVGNAEGTVGKPGDKHYKCRHGNRKTITITKGLLRKLKSTLPRGNVPADGDAAKAYLGKVETATSSILKGLERQARKVQGDFEQEVLNRLLAEWIIACDQPFDEVEKPEFIRLMEYTHHGSTLNFKVPGHTAVRNRVMKMGEDTVEGTRKMFALDSKVSLSLDAWTSRENSNHR
ncbi:hypothetical protein B0H14DRAFT_3441698 [Mycena olivaceomarginata]|nr:hypothetical protein B0H14DRAFT_3441698 [Mycena olivaceomarginata]